MMDDKPKYIRKKCIHNKYPYFCKECGGGGLCEHDKVRSTCKDCDICPHNKLKSRCFECDGNEICEHKIRRSYCIECKGSEICEHNLRKSRCIDCNGSEVCEHKQNKFCCIECRGKYVCPHNKLRYQCIDCGGSQICEHNHRKSICIICTPQRACHHCKLIYVDSNSRWNPYCFRCYCVLHPEEEIPRKFKLKEHYVRDALIEYYKETITMVFDRSVENGCSKRRPDICIDFGSHCLMIEIDENRHINYSCEEKRMVELYEDIGFRKIVFIRFNPDGYTIGINKYISPFKYTKSGILNLNGDEMICRIQELITKINLYKDQEPLEQLTVEYMFYGD
jgi:hypothetical protein